MLRHPLPIVMMIFIAAISLYPTFAQASVQIRTPGKAAMAWHQKAHTLFLKRQYRKAIKAYQRALHTLPTSPRFNCHRAQFLNYIGVAQTRIKEPYKALQSFYHAAYKTKCKTPKIRQYAKNRYRAMYERWASSIHFRTTPPKARVFRVTATGGVLLGVTPIHITLQPGTYTFQLRMAESRTIQWQAQLKPGHHLQPTFKFSKGNDPILIYPKQPDITAPDVYQIKTKDTQAPTKPRQMAGGLDLPTPNQSARPHQEEKPLPGVRLAGHIRPGPPVYKQVWFWAIIGGVVASAVIIPIAIPKERAIVLGQTPIFRR